MTNEMTICLRGIKILITICSPVSCPQALIKVIPLFQTNYVKGHSTHKQTPPSYQLYISTFRLLANDNSNDSLQFSNRSVLNMSLNQVRMLAQYFPHPFQLSPLGKVKQMTYPVMQVFWQFHLTHKLQMKMNYCLNLLISLLTSQSQTIFLSSHILKTQTLSADIISRLF